MDSLCPFDIKEKSNMLNVMEGAFIWIAGDSKRNWYSPNSTSRDTIDHDLPITQARFHMYSC